MERLDIQPFCWGGNRSQFGGTLMSWDIISPLDEMILTMLLMILMIKHDDYDDVVERFASRVAIGFPCNPRP